MTDNSISIDAIRRSLAERLAKQAVQQYVVVKPEPITQVQEPEPGVCTHKDCDPSMPQSGPCPIHDVQEEPEAETEPAEPEQAQAEEVEPLIAEPKVAPPTASIRIDKWDGFKSVVKMAAVLVEEARLNIRSDGISICHMDYSHVALLNAVFASSECWTYNINRDFEVWLRTEDLVKGLVDLNAKESLEASITDETLKFKAGGSDFSLYTIETSSESTPLPKIAFTCTFSLSRKEFLRILKKVEKFSDHVRMTVTRRGITFYGKGDSGDVTDFLEVTDLDSKEEKVEATYSIDYLLNITKAATGCEDTISISYGTKMPLRITFRVGTASTIEYYLAPRLEA